MREVIFIQPPSERLGELTEQDLGGKAFNLSVLARAGFRVPPGFCLLSDCFQRAIKDAGLTEVINEFSERNHPDPRSRERLQEIRDIIVNLPLPNYVCENLRRGFASLGANQSSEKGFAVRSSSVQEDQKGISGAGQYDSVLGVHSEDDLFLAVKRCWASLFTERSTTYRKQRGLPLLLKMGVIVQVLISAEKSGVAFTRHPSNGDLETMVIESTWGLGDILVSGRITPDTLSVARSSNRVEAFLGSKRAFSKPTRRGVIHLSMPAKLKERASLEQSEALTIRDVSLEIEKLFGCPQDIEWVINRNRLFIVQTRPITALPA